LPVESNGDPRPSAALNPPNGFLGRAPV